MGCGASSAADTSPTHTSTNPRATVRPGYPAGTTTIHTTGARNGGSNGPWVLEGGPVTLSQLGLKRQTFWETRTSGSATVWANLRLAAEALLENNTELATTVLEAADLRCANRGDMSLIYDSRGASYELPRYTYSNPSNIVTEAEMARHAHDPRSGHTGPVVDVPILFRISSSSTHLEQDVRLTLRSNMTAGQVKMFLHEHLLSGASDQAADPTTPRPNKWTGVGLPPARQRLLFMGRVLADDVYLQEAKVGGGSIVQVFVRPS